MHIQTTNQPLGLIAVLLAILLSALPFRVDAVIDGITGPSFNLTAEADYINTPDGDSLLIWGYAADGGVAQIPGPTLIVTEGDTVTINLSNNLPLPASIVFPGLEGVVAFGGTAGLLTQESIGAGDTVTYAFTATHPGTYMYHSGTRPELQIEMGLSGTIIIRPNSGANFAYNDPGSAFDHEYLFFQSEMDPVVHELVALATNNPTQFDQIIGQIDNTTYNPVLWFLNGRNGPDTMGAAFDPLRPNQPYNCLPRIHPGETMLLRVVGGGRDMHPFHTHGNHLKVIARDGRLLESAPGSGLDLARVDFTLQTVPGNTYDALWDWTGKGLGWDIYGHAPGDPMEPNEHAADHGKALPVILPEQQDLAFGGFYSGNPFLGQFSSLPPGEGGLNLNGGLFFMWHSHAERELVNNDIFPGGMMTMCIVEPPGVPIP